MSNPKDFYIQIEEQKKRIKTIMAELKPKLTYNKKLIKLSKNPMLNDIAHLCEQLLNNNDEDEKAMNAWLLLRYGEYFNSRPTSDYKIGSISKFYNEFLTIKELELKQELKLKLKKEKESSDEKSEKDKN